MRKDSGRHVGSHAMGGNDRRFSGGSTIAKSLSLLACKPVTMKHSDATEEVIMIKRPSFPRPCSLAYLRCLTCLGVATALLTMANGGQFSITAARPVVAPTLTIKMSPFKGSQRFLQISKSEREINPASSKVTKPSRTCFAASMGMPSS